MLENDVSKLNIIIEYCDYIENIINRINNNYEYFLNDYEAQQSISFDILQIGEAVNKLSDEFKSEFSKIMWHKIIGMRNYIVHDYGAIDTLLVFNTAKDDIPELQTYCKQILNKKA